MPLLYINLAYDHFSVRWLLSSRAQRNGALCDHKMLGYMLDESQCVVYKPLMLAQTKMFGTLTGMETPQKRLGMKKSKLSPKALDPQKPVGAITPVNEQPHPLPVSYGNISRERLTAGASTTTEVLKEILRQPIRHEPMGRWGINE
jgi:hypothetical protein